MRALPSPVFDFVPFQGLSEGRRVPLERSASRYGGRRKMIVGVYFVLAPIATIAWLAGLVWAAINVVGYALS